MKKCCIVGIDGYDVDALANMVAFYSGCGYSVEVSREPKAAELIVIQRGNGVGAIKFSFLPKMVHIYDYVRNGTSAYKNSLPNGVPFYVISPVESGSDGELLGANWVRGFYPVVPELWSIGGIKKNIHYKLVHLGHKKPQQDAFQDELAEMVSKGLVDVWGRGWIGPEKKIHGPISLHECSGIYKKSAQALGVMYGAQRWNSLSGRMWQGPISGCIVYTESLPSSYSEIPGVVLCKNYKNIDLVVPNYESRINLADNATKYWISETNLLAKELGMNFDRPSGYVLKYIYLKYIMVRHFFNYIKG